MDSLLRLRPHAFRAAAAGVLIIGLLTPLPTGAQSLGLGSNGSDGPIEVLADNGIEWQQDTQRFVARGNAQASRGQVTLHADELIAFYDGEGTDGADGSGGGGTGGGTDISRLEAHGNVRITSPSEEATGTNAAYDVAAGRLVLEGDPVRLTTPRETLVANQRLTYDVPTRQAVAEGGAALTQNGRTLRAATLVAHLREVADRTEISRVDARGGVSITTEKETARGSQGNYDAKTGIATLTGSVTLTRGQNVLTGSKAVVNMKTGVSTLYGGGTSDGKARAILTPNQPADGSAGQSPDQQ